MGGAGSGDDEGGSKGKGAEERHHSSGEPVRRDEKMAVYTEVGDDELAAFLAPYQLGRVLALTGIAEGVENTNYLLSTDRGPFILTLYERRVREEDLPYFLALMDHLAERGVPCPVPVRGAGGSALGRLCGRPAAIVTFLKGLWPRRPTPEQCRQVGRALAALHLAGLDFPGKRTNDLSVDGWAALLAGIRRKPAGIAHELADELGRELAVLAQHWPIRLPRGVIHADLFPDNTFFHGDQLTGLIDFYFSCTDILAYDLAVALNAWCFERDGSFNVTKSRRLLAGYAEVRPLTAAEIDALPVLARGAALRFLLTRLHDWLHPAAKALVNPKNPAEYVHKLRFHQRVLGPSAYGID